MSERDGRTGDRHKNNGVFVRLPDETLDQLRVEAHARWVTVAWLVNRLVAEGLANLKPVDESFLTTHRIKKVGDPS